MGGEEEEKVGAMEANDIATFALAMEKLKANPSLLKNSQLDSLRELVLSLGAKPPGLVAEEQVPKAPAAPPVDGGEIDDAADETEAVVTGAAQHEPTVASIADSDDEDPERIPQDSEPFPSLPKPLTAAEPSNQKLNALASAKGKAELALEAGDSAKALDYFTKAIMTGAASALLFTKRGELLLRERRPRAAIADCAAAIEVNPDCGKAYRVRGTAYRRLGNWQASHKDLVQGQKLDYDEGTDELLRFVAQKVQKSATTSATRIKVNWTNPQTNIALAIAQASKTAGAPDAPPDAKTIQAKGEKMCPVSEWDARFPNPREIPLDKFPIVVTLKWYGGSRAQGPDKKRQRT